MAVTARTHTFLHALAFVLGFSLVFVLLGASVAFIGYAINPFMTWVMKIGGLVLIVFGLQVAGLWAWIADRVRQRGGERNALGRGFLTAEDGLSRLMYTEGRAQVKTDRRWGYLSSGMMGVFFSAGWIPCVGPVLASIYMLASSTQTVGQGALLLLIYSAGLGIPFLLTGAAFSSMTRWLRRLNRHLGIVSKVTGLFLILMGALLFTERMTVINSLIVSRFGTGLAGLSLEGGSSSVSVVVAFLAGLLSFLSPCVLPVIPGYIGYLSGTAVAGTGSAAPAASAVRGQAQGTRVTGRQ